MVGRVGSRHHAAVLAILFATALPCAQSAESNDVQAFAGSSARWMTLVSRREVKSKRKLQPTAAGRRTARLVAMSEDAGGGRPLRVLVESLHAGAGSTSVAASDLLRQTLAGVTLADFGAAAAGWPRCYRSTRIAVKVFAISCPNS